MRSKALFQFKHCASYFHLFHLAKMSTTLLKISWHASAQLSEGGVCFSGNNWTNEKHLFMGEEVNPFFRQPKLLHGLSFFRNSKFIFNDVACQCRKFARWWHDLLKIPIYVLFEAMMLVICFTHSIFNQNINLSHCAGGWMNNCKWAENLSPLEKGCFGEEAACNSVLFDDQWGADNTKKAQISICLRIFFWWIQLSANERQNKQ